MNIVNIIIYILLILKINGMQKELKILKEMVLTSDIDESFWCDDEKI